MSSVSSTRRRTSSWKGVLVCGMERLTPDQGGLERGRGLDIVECEGQG